ncbi:MAG: SDR family NAD(P)-dependent oxidoreductase [Pirellulales bacterium]
MRYALVTGAARGLGRAFCRALARDGWCVAVVDIDSAEADETLRLVKQDGGTGRVELCDVTDVVAWRAMRTRLQADWTRLDLLVNNAGMFGAGFIAALDLDAVDRLIRLNLMSVLYGCEVMAPWLVESAKVAPSPPHIINIASVFAHYCPPGMAAYSVSKAGVIALSETLYGELRPRGVGVTVVCPGVMPTRFTERATFDDESYRRLTQTYVRESTLSPEAVADAAIAGMRRGNLYAVEGRRERWYWRVKRMLPQTFLRRVARRVWRDLKRV